ncbi:hypothetical protein [Glycomyces tenuis]|uniref:hypothetical protein n=1 Tax=Glycomyces tenuis TaxID=58116 RepID=UPI00040CB926|nr:hypothetical protein [Glycomyces tenuis]
MARPEPPVSQHGFATVDDIDDAPAFAYKDDMGRRHQADPEPMIDFDSLDDCKAGRSVRLQPREGRGVLDVFVCTAETADATGVLLLDGKAVAAGDGRYQVELPPGEHTVEVQGADAASSAFTLAEGERVCFTTGQGVAIRNQVEYRTQLYRVEDGAEIMPLLEGQGAKASNIGCLTAVAGVVALVVSVVAVMLAPEGLAQGVATAFVLASTAALVTGVAVGITATRRLHRRAASARVGPVHRVAGDGRAIAFPSPIDVRDWRRNDGSHGVAIAFDLFLYRVTRRPGGPASYSGANEALALSHASRPRLRIDDAEVPCDWSTWFYRLPVGEHHFVAEYGPDPVDGFTARHEFSFEVEDVGDVAVVHLPFRVFRVWDESGRRLTAFRPQIASRVTKEARSLVARSQGDSVPKSDWVPPRIWPRNGHGAAE